MLPRLSRFALVVALLGGIGGLLFQAGPGSAVRAENPVSFSVSDLQGHSSSSPTSLQFGPDGKLYVADRYGVIYVYEIVRHGPNDYQVIGTETITQIAAITNHDDDGAISTDPQTVNRRQVTGILVAGTAANPILYVSSSDPRVNDPGESAPLDTNSGIVSRLTQTTPGTWVGANKVDLVRGLPRNEENHAVNGMQLSPAGDTLYLAAGGNTNMGAPSFSFAYQPEYALSAAILSLDLNAIEALATQYDATNDAFFKYDLPTLDDPTRPNSAPGIDQGDPFGGNSENLGANMALLVPGSPVQLHATGFRNAYDLLLTGSGRMFTIDNGPNAGWGGPPANEGPVGLCDNTPDDGGITLGDGLHYVRQLSPGVLYYGGHPNPLRGNPVQVYSDTLGTAAPYSEPPVPFDLANPVECDYRSPVAGENGALAFWPYSTNGLTEYAASNFGGAMQGDLLAAGWNSSNIVRVKLSFDAGDNPSVVLNEVIFTTGGAALDVIAQSDSDPFPGTVWVANLFSFGPAGLLRVYEPAGFTACNGGPDDDDDGDGYTNGDEQAAGSNPCSAASVPADNDGDFVSDVTDPDDDNDGLPDTSDPFAIDASNGRDWPLPIIRNWDQAAGGILGLGLTGLMSNGVDDYLNLFDPAGMTAIGAGGLLTIDDVGPGDALGSANDQAFAFQMGAAVCRVCLNFTAQAVLVNPLQNIGSGLTSQSMGFFIGPGDQSNYLKVAVAGGSGGSGAIDVLLEIDDNVQNLLTFAAPAVLAGNQVALRLTVDPVAGTAQAAYAVDGGPVTSLGAPIALPADWLDGPQGLAVGVIATSGGAPPFTASWTSLAINYDLPAGPGNWNTLNATGPTARHEAAYVELKGKFYLIGGRGLLPVDSYDPLTNTWTAGAPPPLEIHHFQPVVVDDLIYIVGAMTGPFPNETPIANVLIYDPHGDRWYEGPVIPAERRRGSAGVAVYRGSIYVAGGIQNGHVSGTVGWLDAFNPRTGAWTSLANDMPFPRDHTQAAVVGDRLYVLGGRQSSTDDGNVFDDTVPQIDVFDFTTGSWLTLANDLPTPRAGAMVAVLGREILVIGGESDAQAAAHSEVEALDTAVGAWRSLAPLPANQQRHGSGAVVHGSTVYIASGSANAGGGPELTSQVAFSVRSCPVLPAPAGALGLTPTTVDFGNVTLGSTVTMTVSVANPANSVAITLTRASLLGADRSAFALSFTPLRLAPGDSELVPVSFRPTEIRAYGMASTSGLDGSAALSIAHTGANSALTAPLFGHGISGPVPTATPTAPVTPAPSATPTTPPPAGATTRINAGGPSYTDTGGNSWDADRNFNGGAIFTNNQVAVASTDDDPLYRSERYGNFSYVLPVAEAGCYQVELHFAEIWWNTPGGAGVGVGGNGSRVFDVTLEGNPVLVGYDIHAAVGPAAAVIKSYPVSVTDGALNLALTTAVDNAKLSALAVRFLGTTCGGNPTPTATPVPPTPTASNTPSPPTPTHTPAPTNTPPAPTPTTTPLPPTSTPLPPSPTSTPAAPTPTNTPGPPPTTSPPADFSARINAGGPSFIDGGGRVWDADRAFSGGFTYINPTPIANTLDDTLYQTERYGNFAYALNVPAAGCYRVDVHFAEIFWNTPGGAGTGVGGAGSRVFNLSLEGSTRLASFDIHAEVGPAAAVIKSFPVTVSDGVLNVALTTVVDNAKLSALAVQGVDGTECSGTPTPTGTPLAPTATPTATNTALPPTATNTPPPPTATTAPTSTPVTPTATNTPPPPTNTPTPTTTPTSTPVVPTATNTPPPPTNTPTPTTAPTNTPTPIPTSTSAPATAMHIADLDGSGLNEGRNWTVLVTVHVRDNKGAPVAAATVTGLWVDGLTGTSSCLTDANGLCSVSRTGIRKNVRSVTLTVTSVTHSGLIYTPGANTDPDGDSDGTTITVFKP